jgi:hypothetical protein
MLVMGAGVGVEGEWGDEVVEGGGRGWGWGLEGGERGRIGRSKPKPYQVTPQKTNPSQKPIFQLQISYSPLKYQNFL